MKRATTLIIALLLIAAPLASCSKPEQPLTAAELLDLGERYLLELDYEQAIVYFEQLIEIEPRNQRGYTGLAEAYLALDDADMAVVVLRQGAAQLPDSVEIAALLARIAPIDTAESNQADYVDEDGVHIVALGERDENGNRTGFWIENHFNAETGEIVFLREGNYVDGKLSGEDKCIWIDETVAAKYGTGYGFGIGTYMDNMRNGRQNIECFIDIEINAPLDAEYIYYDDCVGVNLVYSYKGNMVDEMLEDTTGTAYQMWIDDRVPDGKVEYIGEFRNGTRNGTGKMWSSDWEFSGEFVDGGPASDQSPNIASA
jgi:tetratricopeptide (TPR) repeat protein